MFIELRRRNCETYYHKEKHECDFIIREYNTVTGAIQVTASLKENREREYDGLMEALNRYDLDEGLILTEDEEVAVGMRVVKL